MMDFYDYGKVFTPGAPVVDSDLFFGRAQEALDLRRALGRPGLHPIVIGNRGVGKTSLAKQVLRDERSQIVNVACSQIASIDDIARSILEQLGVDPYILETTKGDEKLVQGKGTPFNIGIEVHGKGRSESKRKGLGSRRITPWDVYTALRAIRPRRIIIIDEYDALKRDAEEAHAWVASLIKHLSDGSESTDSRIVVIGIAQSAQQLLGGHESIERSAREIYLRPLRREDIIDFLFAAEDHLQFRFSDSVRRSISANSYGYPYYVHLVGLECLDTMVERDASSREVTPDDYDQAVVRAVEKAFRSELRKYADIMKLSDVLEQEIIQVLALAKLNEVPRVTLLQFFAKNRGIDANEVDSALLRLQQSHRYIYVSRNSDVVRFSDPLMKPFIRSHILRQRRVDPQSQYQLPFDAPDDAE